MVFVCFFFVDGFALLTLIEGFDWGILNVSMIHVSKSVPFSTISNYKK